MQEYHEYRTQCVYLLLYYGVFQSGRFRLQVYLRPPPPKQAAHEHEPLVGRGTILPSYLADFYYRYSVIRM
jgi:hypothetical protein